MAFLSQTVGALDLTEQVYQRLLNAICELKNASQSPGTFLSVVAGGEKRGIFTRHQVLVHCSPGSGMHHCLGATLARLEGQAAFKALAERFDALHLETEDFVYQPSITFCSHKSLPVTWY
jgi:hypothetical protein